MEDGKRCLHVLTTMTALWLMPGPTVGAEDVYQCRKVSAAGMRVDGKMSEAFWKNAEPIRLVNIKDGSAPAVTSEVRLAWTDKFLCVFGVFEDDSIVATINERDGDLWREDAFELFVNPVPDQLVPYVEFEVNPLGTLFDIMVFHPRKTLAARYVNPWKHNFNVPGVELKTAITRGPTPSWRVELKIPLSAFVLTQPVPLAAGHRWRVGVFRIDQHSTDAEDRSCYSWQTDEKGRFHAPERFGVVEFVK